MMLKKSVLLLLLLSVLGFGVAVLAQDFPDCTPAERSYCPSVYNGVAVSECRRVEIQAGRFTYSAAECWYNNNGNVKSLNIRLP